MTTTLTFMEPAQIAQGRNANHAQMVHDAVARNARRAFHSPHINALSTSVTRRRHGSRTTTTHLLHGGNAAAQLHRDIERTNILSQSDERTHHDPDY